VWERVGAGGTLHNAVTSADTLLVPLDKGRRAVDLPDKSCFCKHLIERLGEGWVVVVLVVVGGGRGEDGVALVTERTGISKSHGSFDASASVLPSNRLAATA
jgi:hypothetical protein